LFGPAFWEILNNVSNVHFVVDPKELPYLDARVLMLPYTARPDLDWRKIPLTSYDMIIMHQCVSGVVGNNGHLLTNDYMPDLPVENIIFSGDIHNHQVVEMGNGASVQYIGAPHPINFGDDYECRLIEIDLEKSDIRLIDLRPPKKWMLDITSISDLPLPKESFEGNMAKVRYHMLVSQIDQWPSIEQAVKDWATKHGVTLYGVEPVLDGPQASSASTTHEALLSTPSDVFKAFLAEENLLGTPLAKCGETILKSLVK
jgi:hypothetical protein